MFDEDSYEDYLEWKAKRGKFRENGSHPWEIERGGSVTTDAHLYICDMSEPYYFDKSQANKSQGYCFALSFHPLNAEDIVRGFTHMRDIGIPVFLYEYENVARLLKREDYIGIVANNEDIVYKKDFKWAEAEYGNVFDYRRLPDKNAQRFISKVIWKPLVCNKKRVIRKNERDQ